MIFSVIIPFEYHRGQWRQCLAAWTGQRFDADAFELIVAIPPEFSKRDRDEVEAALRPHDRIVAGESHHDMGLSAVGARHARGRFLFFTESHCWPDADVLDICLHTFAERPDWAGFSCRSQRVADTSFAAAEADMYEGDIARGMTVHPWLKILDQCFATHRSAYDDCGGLQPELGHFAEWALAGNYHVRDLAIGYQPAAKFHHQYVGEAGELITFTRDFVAGEIAYLDAPADARVRKILDVPYEWSCQGNWDAGAWLTLARIALTHRPNAESPGTLRHRAGRIADYSMRALRAALDARLIAPFQELRAHIGFRKALLASDRDGHSPAFRAYIAACIRAHRLRLIRARRSTGGQRAFDAMAPGNTGLYPEEAPDPGKTHPGKPDDESRMRWTEPYALLRGRLDGGRHRIEIRCAELRPLKEANLALYHNARRIPDEDVSITGASIRFTATQPQSGACTLALICTNALIAPDGRPLGLPLKAIETSPCESVFPCAADRGGAGRRL